MNKTAHVGNRPVLDRGGIVPKQQLNPVLDPECQAIYRDLEALVARAVAMRERYDRENVAVGKWWGVARNLTFALDDIRFELRIEEIPESCLPLAGVIEEVLRVQDLDQDGRIVGGIWDGKTPAEVLAEREQRFPQ